MFWFLELQFELCKNDLLWHNYAMILLELQHQAELLPLHERAALIRHLRHSLTDTEREALMLEEALTRLDELQNGTVKRVSWVGIGASEIGDLSERVDELLFTLPKAEQGVS
jgi:Putative addiction module component